MQNELDTLKKEMYDYKVAVGVYFLSTISLLVLCPITSFITMLCGYILGLNVFQ